LHNVLRPAVEFFYKELKIKKLEKLDISFMYWWPLSEHGQTWYTKEKKTGKIEINGKLPEYSLVVTLAHEMVHLKQFSSGLLELDEEENWIWDNVNYGKTNTRTDKHYYNLPWEKEAWTLQSSLALKYYGKLIQTLNFKS